VPPSVKDRIAFWKRLHDRLAKLSNRLNATAQAKLVGDVHARIPANDAFLTMSSSYSSGFQSIRCLVGAERDCSQFTLKM
jgi:hypothetical protein